nr:hypothetical protein [Nostoc sp. CmiSLP01]MDZ8287098.1 hypothetical protein [Nostoc sp. ChiSLP01]
MKSSNSFLAVAVAIASVSFTVSVKADTVNARCDVAMVKAANRILQTAMNMNGTNAAIATNHVIA